MIKKLFELELKKDANLEITKSFKFDKMEKGIKFQIYESCPLGRMELFKASRSISEVNQSWLGYTRRGAVCTK